MEDLTGFFVRYSLHVLITGAVDFAFVEDSASSGFFRCWLSPCLNCWLLLAW